MTPERLSRIDRALDVANCELFVSAASADVHYLTDSEDGNALVLYQPSRGSTVVVRAGGLNCVVDSAKNTVVVPYGVGESPIPLVAKRVRSSGARRVAVGPLPSEWQRD